MPDVVVLQHLPHEHAGVLRQLLAGSGLGSRTVQLWRGEPVPEPDGIGALVVLGGDMNTDQADEYPQLSHEVALLERCVAGGVPVLGICLGAQLLAMATGGHVMHGAPEIGYVPVHLTPAGRQDHVLAELPDATPTFNAHADTIALGPDAVLLAHSAATPVHAFRVGPAAWGVQFHPEFDAALVAGYIAAPGVDAYLRGGGCDPQALLAEARTLDAAHTAMGAALFTRFLRAAALVGRGSAAGGWHGGIAGSLPAQALE